MTLVFDLDIKGDILLPVTTARISNSSPDTPPPFHIGADRSVSASKINCEATSTCQGVSACSGYPRIIFPNLDIGRRIAIVATITVAKTGRSRVRSCRKGAIFIFVKSDSRFISWL